MQEVTYHLPEIHCEACDRSVRRALSELDGVGEVAVDLGAKRVRVRFDAARTDAAGIRARIERAGFDVA